MKLMLLSCVVLLYSYFAASNGSADDSVSINTLIKTLKGNQGSYIIGYERIYGARDLIPGSKVTPPAITPFDLASLSDIIANNTDYECLTGKDYIIIFPKDAPSRHDLALAKRKVVVPDEEDIGLPEVLAQIRGVDQKDWPLFLDGPFFNDSSIEGLIAVKGGQRNCYELLNEIARQLKAKIWIIDHIELNVPATKKINFPLKLGAGNVSFF